MSSIFPNVEDPQAQDLQAMSSCEKTYRFYVLYYLSKLLASGVSSLTFLETIADETTETNAGYTYGSILSDAGLNKTVIKPGPGKLAQFDASSINDTPVYIKIYDKATVPDETIDTPVYRYLTPGRTSGAGTNPQWPSGGINFINGISLLMTKDSADTGNTGVDAGEVIANYGYR